MTSIFTAEICAIKEALDYIETLPDIHRKFVIFCDSKSVLESIDSQETKNPLMVDILDKIQYLIQRLKYNIKFCWLPSHVGIRGNEQADLQARAGLDINIEPRNHKVPYRDFIPKVKTYIKNLWLTRWIDNVPIMNGNKLFEINPTIRPFYINGLKRKDEVIIHRLRIGHTRLTHRYLMERTPVPRCFYCGLNVVLSVKHIMIECLHFANIRSRFYCARDMGDLFERFSLKHILTFLNESGLYNLI